MIEGLEANTKKYSMPISFSGDQSTKNEKMKVPQYIETNNGENLTLINDTNIKGTIKIPKNTPIEFGAGENKQTDAGKITYGTLHDNGLCIVGGGGAQGQGARQVHVWDDLTVDRNLDVKYGDINIKNNHGINTNWLKTNELTVGNTPMIRGIQVGRRKV